MSVGLASLGAFVIYFAIGGYFAEWVAVGVVISLIYRGSL